jgi:hypothetical protein
MNDNFSHFTINTTDSREGFEIIEGIDTTQWAGEGSRCIAEVEEQSMARMVVVVVEVAEAVRKVWVGKEHQAGMVGGVAWADRVKVVGELGAGDTHSIAVGFE